MENVLLTEEEIAKRNEWFEYEMTQVVLALKDKYENAEKPPSPVKALGLVAGDVGKRPDFVPLPGKELEKQPLDVPATQIRAGFVPLADIRPIGVFGDEVQSVLLADSRANFVPLPKVGNGIIVQELPATEINIEYNPRNTEAVDIVMQDVPSLVGANSYTPYTSVVSMTLAKSDVPLLATEINIEYNPRNTEAVDIVMQDVPSLVGTNSYTPYLSVVPTTLPKSDVPLIATEINIEYKPAILEGATTEMPEIPNLMSIGDYAPYKTSEMTQTSVDDIPVTSIKVAYDPMSLQSKVQPVAELPNMVISSVFTPYVRQEEEALIVELPNTGYNVEFQPLKSQDKARGIECPVINAIPNYSPIDLPTVDSIREDISQAKPQVHFTASKNGLESLPQISVPSIGKTSEYKPIRGVDFKKLDDSVPEHNIAFAYSKKEIIADSMALGSELQFSAEFTTPKDFYAMWMDTE